MFCKYFAPYYAAAQITIKMQGCGKLVPTDIVFSDLILATCLWC